jgi:hypothetical protein
MNINAFVVWIEVEKPWEFEDLLISDFKLPLNLKNNPKNECGQRLSSIRKQSETKAQNLPILDS